MDSGIPKTRWARTVDGACIAYQDFGSGPITLVLIHGWVSHLELWWEEPRFARFMRRLARSMRVIHFDKRGTGLSDRVNGPLDIGVRMDDVRAGMDAAGVERAALFGYGTGGSPLAVVFASTYPERTSALVIDGDISERYTEEYPWGLSEEELDCSVATLVARWGEEEGVPDVVSYGFGDDPAEHPPLDPHGRDRGHRRGREWAGRAHRRQGCRSRWSLGGARQLDRQGPRRRLGVAVRRARRARAQGSAGDWRLYAVAA